MLCKTVLEYRKPSLYQRIIGSGKKSPTKVNPFHWVCWNFPFAFTISILFFLPCSVHKKMDLFALWLLISWPFEGTGRRWEGAEGKESKNIFYILTSSPCSPYEMAVSSFSTKGGSPQMVLWLQVTAVYSRFFNSRIPWPHTYLLAPREFL